MRIAFPILLPCVFPAHEEVPAGDWQARVGQPDRFVKVDAPPYPKQTKPHHLGRGAFGKVVLMHDQARGTKVAIKKIQPSSYSSWHDVADASPDRMRRYRDDCAREAQWEYHVGKDIHSPLVATARELFIDPKNGKPFLVFDYVPGVPLYRANTTKPAVQRQIMADILAGLAVCHRAGIVHSDLSTNNVLVHKGRAVIIDLGCSKRTDAPDDILGDLCSFRIICHRLCAGNNAAGDFVMALNRVVEDITFAWHRAREAKDATYWHADDESRKQEAAARLTAKQSVEKMLAHPFLAGYREAAIRKAGPALADLA